ncbi:uncharacterized protein LOC130078447 [Rhinichthys klamathensis goyatoka]|uniref:uncharacterized protein LOC130078447 n=1 Tax=Rhinichthys klamathensis goyatoka TaxID=3034132 RepID=UPI0024B4FB91|nr:uncharacterized protein LOC130078447 [Rhinichthys klamathensis goyatoka]
MHDIDAEEEALQIEKAKLKRKREQLEVEAKLAVATARLSVFENVCGGEDVEDNGEDAMNAYLHAHLKSQTSSCLNTAPVLQLPKTVSFQQDHSLPLAVRPKGRLHISQAQSLLRSDNPFPSVSYAPSSHRSEVQGNVLGTRPTNVAPAGPQPSISHRSRPTHMHESDVQGNGSRFTKALTTGFSPLTTQGSIRMQSQSHHHCSLDNVQHPTLYDLMQQQTNITAQLVQNQALASLPPRTIPEFDGDPLKYAAFIRAFEQAIERKTTNKQECLYYLEQYTRGQPRELVRSCYNMALGQGYERAKNLLKEHFGNETKIAVAYMEKAMTWSTMRVDDIDALQSFSIFLRDCCNVMEDLQHMEELNVPSNLRLIMMKLPYKLREKWRSVAWELQERRGYRAMFPDFVVFIERQIKILSDPLFGDLQGMPPDLSSNPKSRHTGRGQATVAAINTASGSPTSAAWYQQRRGPVSQRNVEGSCCVCKSQHSVEKCSQLDEMTHREKLEALKVGRVCFSCLRRGHMSRECDKPLTCDICKHKHPTVLHIESKTQEVSVNNASVSLETCGHTGAGSDECVLAIVPVQVKAKSGSTIMNTYAFLDPGSSASFCTQHLMRKLNLSGVKTSILLCTLGQERSVDTILLSGLEVSGLNGENFLDLPEVYTQRTMPVSRNNILTQQDLEGWKYLEGITVPSFEAEVELLIGTNAPKLMEPREIINSQGEGPYAVRTLLGWVVNGSLRGGEPRKGKMGRPAVTANRISVPKLKEQIYELESVREETEDSVASLQAQLEKMESADTVEAEPPFENLGKDTRMISLEEELQQLKEEMKRVKAQSNELQGKNYATVEALSATVRLSEERLSQAKAAQGEVEQQLSSFQTDTRKAFQMLFPHLNIEMHQTNWLEAFTHEEQKNLKENQQSPAEQQHIMSSSDVTDLLQKLILSEERQRLLQAECEQYRSTLSEMESTLKVLQSSVEDGELTWKSKVLDVERQKQTALELVKVLEETINVERQDTNQLKGQVMPLEAQLEKQLESITISQTYAEEMSQLKASLSETQDQLVSAKTEPQWAELSLVKQELQEVSRVENEKSAQSTQVQKCDRDLEAQSERLKPAGEGQTEEGEKTGLLNHIMELEGLLESNNAAEVDETKKKLFCWRHCGHNGSCRSTRVLADGKKKLHRRTLTRKASSAQCC